MSDLAKRLATLGFEFTPTFDGEIQRFARGGSGLSGWARGETLQVGGKVVRRLTFGDWRTGEEYEWDEVGGEKLTPEEEAEFKKALKEAKNQRKIEKEKVQEETALTAAKVWAGLVDRGESPYFRRKGLSGLYGCKLDVTDSGIVTVVPARDIHGKLWGLQRVLPVKGDAGDKFFLKGMKTNANFHLIGEIDESTSRLYLAEGVATAASIYEATKCPVVACFNAGNLLAVLQAFRGKYPTLEVMVCGDDDRHTRKPNGTPWNPGRDAAEGAARECAARVYLPRFQSPSGRGSDCNDLHVLEGLSTLASQLEEAWTQSVNVPDKKKKERISEKTVAGWLLEKTSPNLIRQDKSLFLYDGKRWNELFEADHDRLKNDINAMMGDRLGCKEVNDIFRTFMRYVPHVPRGVNLFRPNPTCANFQDGTLHLRRDLGSGAYSTEFRPHSREDYLCWVVPFRYNTDRKIRNEKLLQLIDEAFQDDPDKDAKIRSLKQMGGAMLLPAFAQMFFLHGVSGSRKSTIGKVLVKGVSIENVSFLDPSSMEGFMLEGMVGKLVNANLDIDDFGALPRNFLKRFEDGLPFPVNRKNKPVANATLPFVHVYAANKLPANFETSRALERRITMIRFDRDLTNDNRKGEIKYYDDIVFASSPEGVYNFMLEGLEDLISQGGRFTPPESGLRDLKRWQEERDPVALFLDAVKNNEAIDDKNAPLITSEGAKIERARLFAVAALFWQKSNIDARRISNRAFYDALRSRKFVEKKSDGVRYFLGIGVRGAPGQEGEASVLHPQARM